MITVINGKKDGFIGIDKIYIGRRNSTYNLNESVLANPFTIGKDGDRIEVITKYRIWLWRQVNKQGVVWNELRQIAKLSKDKNIQLVCWCKPYGCHGDIIKNCINWIIDSGQL